MKKKIVIIGVIIGIIILGIVVINIYLYRVRSIGGEQIGYIWKDEKGSVTAEIWIALYNGTNDDKKVIFDVDGGAEYLEGNLKEEKYEVTKIEILEGNGQIDIENMVLTIPRQEIVELQITAQNIYVGKDYQGEAIFLRREAPNMRFFTTK